MSRFGYQEMLDCFEEKLEESVNFKYVVYEEDWDHDSLISKTKIEAFTYVESAMNLKKLLIVGSGEIFNNYAYRVEVEEVE